MRFRKGPMAFVLVCVLPFAHASTTMHGLPLLRQFGASQSPAGPTYTGVVVDRAGKPSGEGVMVFRSGVWDLLEASGEAPVYSIMPAHDGMLLCCNCRPGANFRLAALAVTDGLIGTTNR